MRGRLAPIAAFALLSWPGLVAAGGVPRLEIVDRAIEFHGGPVYESSESSLTISSRSGSFGLRVRMDGGRYEYTVSGETRDGQARIVEVTNDSVAVTIDGEPQNVPAEDEQRWRDFASARVYFAFLPYRLNDDSVFKEDLGLERWDGRDLHKVKVTFAAGSSTDADDEYLYWFDPESGRVEQLAYSFAGNPGGLRFRRGLNYRRVGGILFFDQQNLGVEGEGLRVDRIDPAFVADTMREVSIVRLSDLDVVALSAVD